MNVFGGSGDVLNMQPHEHDAPELPDELVKTLKRADRRVTMLTNRVDRDVMAAAAGQFGARTPRRGSTVRWAAAAAVALLAILVLPVHRIEHPAVESTQPVVEETIVDVLRLAREGKLSQVELDRIAARIVAVNPGDDT